MIHQQKKTAAVAAVAGALGLALSLTACGSSSNSADKADSSTSASSGKKATGSPVTIGALSWTEGSGANDEPTRGLKAAEWYVNNVLGGVSGHQLKLDICTNDLTPESGVRCGNHFVAAKVPAVIDSWDTAIGSAAPILQAAKIPWAGVVSGDITTETLPYGTDFYWTGPLAITAMGIMPMMQDLKVNRADFIALDVTAAHAYFDKVLIPMAQRIGVSVKVSYLDPATTSFDTAAAAAIKDKPDMIGNLTLGEDQCTSLISSLRSQGWTKPIYGGSCERFIEDLPSDQSAGVTDVARTWLPKALTHAPKEQQDQLQGMLDALKATGDTKNVSTRTVYAFISVIDLVQALNHAGVTTVTPDTVRTAIESLKDTPSFLGPPMTCDGKIFPGTPSACANQGIYYTVKSDGTLEPGDPNGFVDLDINKLLGL